MTDIAGRRDRPVEVAELAKILFDALQAGGPTAVISGDPLDADYFCGDLICGVLLDGRFDFLRVASAVAAHLEMRRKSET